MIAENGTVAAMDLHNIPPHPQGARRVHFSETISAPKGLDQVGIMKIGPRLEIEGDIEYSDGDLMLSGNVRGTQLFDCSRCLEPIDRPFEKFIFLTFARGAESINAVPDIGEEVMVDSPINVLCREDCRGLCVRCGANLNAGPCACKKENRT